MSQPSDDDLAARLEGVNDDVTPLEECQEWLVARMHEGRSPDDLLAELISLGWAEDDVQPLVDEARRRTRDGHGVLSARNAAASAFKRAPVIVGGAGGVFAKAAFGAAKLIEKQIAAETDEVRYRLSHGLCHQCGYDVSRSTDRCPECGTPIVRRQV